MRGRGTATVEMEFRHRSAGIFRWDTERWSTEGVVGKVGGAEMNISWPWASTYQVDVQWCSPKFQTFSSRLLQMSLVPTSIILHPGGGFFRPRRRAFATPRNQRQLLAGGALRWRLPATLWAFPGAACHMVPTAQWAAGTIWREDEPETCYLFLGGDYPVVGKELRSYDSIREVFFPDNQEHRD